MDDGGAREVAVDGIETAVPSAAFASERDEATICYPIRGDLPLGDDDELLMIRKRRGLGADLYNGPGGKVEPGETPAEAAVRETREETGVDVGAVDKRGEFDFFFGDEHVFCCHVYVGREVSGVPEDTPEAFPEWRARRDVPYDEMWEDDVLWVPRVLDGDTIRGVFYFDDDGDDLLEYDVAAGVDGFD
ncbi:8-oxo-dGTP diphosphatase [Halorubellus sp. JP-L1]|uniref:8-oxo-dGTP diphosphatase n=1 Tax=Halorubellus sp. JP-L1 TaxID=2715753 RepID=UPI00140AECE9|nr:8-oxo-dGTP diphosphatase [Halorubellus sp. JP-L1]NHN42239.1 8-oxo-dGTP diphosphatase [Halorubellus sp. JP-L1]